MLLLKRLSFCNVLADQSQADFRGGAWRWVGACSSLRTTVEMDHPLSGGTFAQKEIDSEADMNRLAW